MSDMTPIFDAIQRGDPKAQEKLLPLVYAELRRIAAGKMAAERPGQTMQTTALVHEAWLRLGGNDQQAWQNRAHFFTGRGRGDGGLEFHLDASEFGGPAASLIRSLDFRRFGSREPRPGK